MTIHTRLLKRKPSDFYLFDTPRGLALKNDLPNSETIHGTHEEIQSEIQLLKSVGLPVFFNNERI